MGTSLRVDGLNEPLEVMELAELEFGVKLQKLVLNHLFETICFSGSLRNREIKIPELFYDIIHVWDYFVLDILQRSILFFLSLFQLHLLYRVFFEKAKF